MSEGVLRRAEASLDAVRTTASARECASASTEFLKFVRRLVDAESANAVGVVQKWGVTQARNAPTCLPSRRETCLRARSAGGRCLRGHRR